MFAIISIILCPILSLPFIVYGLKKDHRHTKLYLFVVAVFISLFSYTYTPATTEDITRHHLETIEYEGADLSTLAEDLYTKPEQLSVTYKYIIGQTGNENLLQFFTSIVCYYILFYLLDDFARKNKSTRGRKLIGIWLFVLSGFHFTVITSGIFYTLALELFSLGVYISYEKDKKIAGIIISASTILIHTCAVLPFMILVLYRVLGSKINMKNIIIMALSIMSIGYVLAVIAPSMNIPLVSEISNLYRWYFNNESEWSSLHTPLIMTLYLSRLVPIFIAYKLSPAKREIAGFSLFIAIAVVVLYPQTTFSIRYIHIAVLCGIPLLFNAVQHEKYGKYFVHLLYLIATMHISYQVYQLVSGLYVCKDIDKVLVTNILETLGR